MKKQKTKLRHRVLALALALMLCVGMLPMAAFAASAGDICPQCKEGKLYESNGYLYCSNTGVCDYKVAIEPDKPTEHKCETFDGTDHCTECGKLNPTHAHSYDSTGKCICGEQHTHSWNYSMYDRTEHFTHKAYCSCGATKEEPCTTETVYEWGQQVIKCTLCGYWEPVEDVHNWGKWEPDGNGNHTHKCTDPNCNEAKTEECQLTAKSDGTVSCDICGWIKFDDGKPDSGDNTGCEHEFGNVGVPAGEEAHTVTCMKCHQQEKRGCSFKLLTDEKGDPLTWRCEVCGNLKSIDNDGQYCIAGQNHQWDAEKEVLSEDGNSVLTTLTCKVCGKVKVSAVCTSPAKVVVKYQYEDGKEAHAPQSQSVIKGTYYSITSPAIEGYKPDIQIVFGISEGKGDEVTVTYRKVETYTLTVKYEFPGGDEVFPTHTEELEAGTTYEVPSPKLHGYTPELEIVKGTMPAADEKVTVKYTLNEYKWTIKYVDEKGNTLLASEVIPYTVESVKDLKASDIPVLAGYEVVSNNIADTQPKPDTLGNVVSTVVYKPITYTLTIKYEFVGGMTIFDPYVAELGAGTAYEVTSPESDYTFGYAPDQKVVVGEMPAESLEVVVKYLPIPYKWTINYVDEKGNTLYDTFETTYTIQNAKLLNIPPIPEVDGYKVKTSNVQAPDPEKLGDVECEVVYEPITYTWTINYVDEKGTELFEPVVAEFNVTTTLDSVTSPTKKGYSADTPVVERPTDKAENQSFTVTYSLSTDFALTVVHRYLNRDGSLNHEVTEELGKFTIGYQYSTAAKNEEGYTLSLTPANANGTFGEEDVTVTYEYTANAAPVTPVIPTNPSTSTPTPTPTPDPDEDIEDPDVPLGPNPGDPTPTPTPDPDEEIEDPDVPLGPNPGEPTPTPDPDEEIEDPDVPLAPGPVDPDAEPTPAPTTKPAPAPDKDEEISDEKVPLANTPKTGDDTGVWMTLALASAAGLALLGLSRKRKGQNVR